MSMSSSSLSFLFQSPFEVDVESNGMRLELMNGSFSRISGQSLGGGFFFYSTAFDRIF